MKDETIVSLFLDTQTTMKPQFLAILAAHSGFFAVSESLAAEYTSERGTPKSVMRSVTFENIYIREGSC